MSFWRTYFTDCTGICQNVRQKCHFYGIFAIVFPQKDPLEYICGDGVMPFICQIPQGYFAANGIVIQKHLNQNLYLMSDSINTEILLY